MTNMKRIVPIVLMAILGVASSQACVKKAAESQELIVKSQEPAAKVIVLVMDSSKALIEGAEMKVGKQTLRTSWDGRFVLTAEQLSGVDKLSIRCEGYEAKTVKAAEISRQLSAVSGQKATAVVILKRDKKATPKEPYYGGGKMRSGMKGEVYYTLGARSSYKSAVYADVMMVEEAAVADDAVMPMIAGASNGNVSAGKLTAGEVNDFTKWYFWPTVLDSTHKKFVSTWKMAPRHRYTVQVTNRNGYPLVNRAVSLLDARGNTLYQAVTDNTGKAELWAELVNGKGVKGEDLQIRVEQKTVAAKEWSEGLNAIVIDETCEAPESVDVVFVFDATGSMGDELRYLQAEMKDVIARSQQAVPGVSVRTGAVVYRDKGDEYVTRLSRLTEDIATTQQFIDRQQASGGGDYEEAVPEALMAAINSAGWDENARARIAFLILDAPCHEDSATVALLHEQVLNAAAQGIRIVPVVCSGLGESGELLLRSIALATNGTSFFLTDDSGIGHTHLKPTTDSLKVEHLNDMLVRTIVEFSTIPNCEGHWNEEAENADETFVPNPFEIKDLSPEEIKQKDSRMTLYLLDVSGKLIYVYHGYLEDAGDSQLSRLPLPMLSTGVYFVKAFYDGEWHTKKILVH
jgi:hypothetical protein